LGAPRPASSACLNKWPAARARIAALSAGQQNAVCSSRAVSSRIRNCCCSTSRRTTSISNRFSGSRILGSTGAARCFRDARPDVSQKTFHAHHRDRPRQLIGWACDYDTFLVRKEAVLEAEEVERAQSTRTRTGRVWIRRGVKAQRSRANNRIHASKKCARARRPPRPNRQSDG